MPKGFFARNALPTVRKNCKLVVGWFNETLPKFVKDHKDLVALLHVDSDLYSSAVTVLNTLNHQLVEGTVIVFDEYMNYPGWQLDEFKAWQEFVSKNNIKYEYESTFKKQKLTVPQHTKNPTPLVYQRLWHSSACALACT